MAEKPTIECKRNGPYLVKNLETLHDATGAAIPTRPVVALCRCGGSANKPFCDGTHARIGFSGAGPTEERPAKRRDYRGQKITIHDNRALCAHVAQCTDNLASVFKYGSKPWIDPDGADVAAIVKTVRACPSGALAYTLEGEPPAPPAGPSITVLKKGPYAVAGEISMTDSTTGRTVGASPFTLCRCGASNNKPFCDGTHWNTNFDDSAD